MQILVYADGHPQAGQICRDAAARGTAAVVTFVGQPDEIRADAANWAANAPYGRIGRRRKAAQAIADELDALAAGQ